MKVFWSWQSDTSGHIGRHFIKDVLREVISDLKLEQDIEEAKRDELHLDSDRQGVPDSPDLARTIFEKIDSAALFIADVTLIGKAHLVGSEKKLINSNVAIELGYALKAAGSRGVLMVMNEVFGGRTDLPFDLQAKAGPLLFSLPVDSSKDDIKREKARLKTQLKNALKLCVESYVKPNFAKPQVVTAATGSVWLSA